MADPYYVLPIVMGATQFLQVRMAPQAGDPMQRRMFQLMPIFMTFLFLGFPSGLVLYWLTNNVLTILQQAVYNRLKERQGVMAHETEFPHETTLMNEPKRRFFSGDTLQQALIQAANYFNLDPSYDRLPEPREAARFPEDAPQGGDRGGSGQSAPGDAGAAAPGPGRAHAAAAAAVVAPFPGAVRACCGPSGRADGRAPAAGSS